MIERPPNYESLTLTNSSAEFGHHSLSSSNENFQPLNNRALNDIKVLSFKPIVTKQTNINLTSNKQRPD